MALAQVLQDFRGNVTQCEALMANAHKNDAAGAPIFPPLDRQQITVAAFLNFFIAWETFLEESLVEFMTGGATISGKLPTRYVSPVSPGAANEIVVGVMRFFDYGNHENVRKIAKIYFDKGYPYEPHISSIVSELADLRTMRNACAHITSSTQKSLEGLALRLLGAPAPGIAIYRLLTTVMPGAPAGETVFVSYKNKILAAADLIAKG